MGKTTFRFRLYWFLNGEATGTVSIAIILLSVHLPKYFPFGSTTALAMLCLIGGMACRSWCYTRMGWDKERIPTEAVRNVWRFISVILLLLSVLWIRFMGIPPPNV